MKAKTDERGASRTRITAEIKRYHCLRSLDDYIREQKSGSTPGSGKLIEICKIIQRKLEQQPAVMNEMNNPADGMKTMWVYNTFDGCMKRWTMEGVTTLIRSMLLAEVGSSMFDTKGALQHHPELAAQLPPQFTPDEVKAVEKRLKLERSQIQAPAAARKGSRTKRFRSLERRRDTSGQADSTSSSAKRQSRDGRPGKFISTGGQGVEFTKSYGEQELNGSNKDDDNMEGKDNDSDDNDDNDYNPNDDKNGVDKGHRNNDGANRQKRRCFIYSLRTHDSTQPGNGLESVAHSRQTSVQHSRSVHQSGEDTDDEVSMVKGTWPHRALESATTASEEVEQLGARWPHRSRARLENSGEGCFARDVGAGGTSERGEAAQDLLAKKVGMEGLTTKPKDAGHRPDQSSSNLSLARRMPAAPPSPEKPLWDFEAFQSDSLFFANSHSWRCNVDRTQLDKAFNSAQQNWLEAATCLFRPLQPTIRDSKDSRRLLMFVACRLKDATESLIRGGDGGAIEKVVQWNEPSLDLEYGVAAIIGAFAIHEVFKDPTVTFGVDEHVPHIDRIIRNELSDPRSLGVDLRMLVANLYNHSKWDYIKTGAFKDKKIRPKARDVVEKLINELKSAFGGTLQSAEDLGWGDFRDAVQGTFEDLLWCRCKVNLSKDRFNFILPKTWELYDKETMNSLNGNPPPTDTCEMVRLCLAPAVFREKRLQAPRGNQSWDPASELLLGYSKAVVDVKAKVMTCVDYGDFRPKSWEGGQRSNPKPVTGYLGPS